jgi:hypothetical protein
MSSYIVAEWFVLPETRYGGGIVLTKLLIKNFKRFGQVEIERCFRLNS